MERPIFLYKDKKYYNVAHIVNFQTDGVTHTITMSNGDVFTVNTSVKFDKAFYVINPPTYEDNGGKYAPPPVSK
jgi:hypothetical protein